MSKYVGFVGLVSMIAVNALAGVAICENGPMLLAGVFFSALYGVVGYVAGRLDSDFAIDKASK